MKKRITFTLPAEAVRDASEGWLLGSFNDWNKEQGILMKKQKDGSLKVSTLLETGQTYQYRYLLSDGRWENDYNAQQYVPAEGFQTDNCVITVPADEPKEKKAKTTTKKATAKGESVKSKKTTAASKAKDTKSKTTKKQTAKPVAKIEGKVTGKVKVGE